MGCEYLKEFRKSKWFPSLVLLVLELVGLIVLYNVGFRITYTPELENSWDAISAVASWLGAIGTVAAVWFAVLSSDKQIKLSNKQQKQTTGLNLYPERKNVLRSFCAKKYDDTYWDATILFSSEIVGKIEELRASVAEHKRYSNLIKQYEVEMETTAPELYTQYSMLLSQEETSGNHEEVLSFCDDFTPFVYVPFEEKRMVLNYRKLEESLTTMQSKCEALHKEILSKMKHEIEESIR